MLTSGAAGLDPAVSVSGWGGVAVPAAGVDVVAGVTADLDEVAVVTVDVDDVVMVVVEVCLCGEACEPWSTIMAVRLPYLACQPVISSRRHMRKNCKRSILKSNGRKSTNDSDDRLEGKGTLTISTDSSCVYRRRNMISYASSCLSDTGINWWYL